jgi:hypothetical protein
MARTLHFEATTQERTVLQALEILLAHEDARGDWLSKSEKVDLSFASDQWQHTVLARTNKVQHIARRHFEVCVFSNLANALKSGDVAVRGSDAYADYREQLLPWSECESQVDEYCRGLGIPAVATDFVDGIRTLLAETAERFDVGFAANADVGVNVKGERPLARPSPGGALDQSRNHLDQSRNRLVCALASPAGYLQPAESPLPGLQRTRPRHSDGVSSGVSEQRVIERANHGEHEQGRGVPPVRKMAILRRRRAAP